MICVGGSLPLRRYWRGVSGVSPIAGARARIEVRDVPWNVSYRDSAAPIRDYPLYGAAPRNAPITNNLKHKRTVAELFTIIFINDRTSRFIEDYRFLFRPFELRGELSFCNWNEAGETAETAVPDLTAHLGGRHEWRAVILNTDVAERDDSLQLPDSQNPFDYSDADPETGPHMTPIPLIRLSQILGGYNGDPKCEFVDGYAMIYRQKEVRVAKTDLHHVFSDDDDIEAFDINTFIEHARQLISGSVESVRLFSAESIAIYRNRYDQLCRDYHLGQRWVDEIDAEEMRAVYIEKKIAPEVLEKYRALNRHFSLNEPRPVEILLVALRETTVTDERQRIEEAWQAPLTRSNSTFWERHHYPVSCRFLCSDIRLNDVSAFERDKSSFCYALLTLALNRIPAAVLQAYWLYRLNVVIDRKAIQTILNIHLDSLNAVKTVVSERLAKEPETTFYKNETILDVQHVPVVIEKDDADEMFDDVAESEKDDQKGESDELSLRVQNKKKLANAYGRDPRRAIDRAAKSVRERASRFTGSSYELDAVQRENLIENIARLESEILITRPRNRYDKQKVVETANKVAQDVNLKTSSAMDDSAKLKAFVVASIIVVFGFASYLWYSMQSESNATKFGSILLVLAVVIVTLCGGFLAIKWSNAKEKATIDAVTAPLEGLKRDVTETRSEFDQYFTNICTLMKAHAILDGARVCDDASVISRRQLLMHSKAIERRNLRWLGIYEMARENSGVRADTDEFRQDIQPEENPLYYLEPSSEGSEIPLNSTGDVVMQPYPFVERLIVEREEVFEKTGMGASL